MWGSKILVNFTEAVKRRSSVKTVLKVSAQFRGEHLCWSLFFKKDPDCSHAALLNRDFSRVIY